MSSQNVFLLSFDTAHPMPPEMRHGLKEWLGEAIRERMWSSQPVSIDSLDPAEPHVAALLPPIG